MIAGMAGYFLYRRRQGLDPTKQYRIPRPERPVGFVEVAYHSALVPDPRHQRRQRGDGARREAGRPRRRGRGRLRAQGPERAAARRRDWRRRSARRAACSRWRACRRKVAGCRVRCRLIRTRNPGARSSRRRGAALGPDLHLDRARPERGAPARPDRRRYVLAHRPCRVIVEHDPTAHQAAMNGNGAVPRSAVTAPKALTTR